MDPVSLGVASIGTGLIGGVLGAAGQSQQSAAQAQMYQYQAGLSAQNAAIAKTNASYALMQGEQQAAQSGMKSRFQQGQIVTGEAASGFDVNSGSNKQVQDSQKLIAGTEETAIRSSAAKTAYDFDVSSQTAQIQSDMYNAAATNVKAAAPLNIASSILGSVSGVASKWSQMSTAGIPLTSMPNIPGFSFGF